MHMTLLERYRYYGEMIVNFFRLDLQLHFFWGFVLTLCGVYWQPLLLSGLIVTVVKEALDVWSKGHWSWGDFWCGIGGCVLALGFLMSVELISWDEWWMLSIQHR
ncbi:hypothetical protein Dde_1857 [Oleidesulfovibrio alaskensis G20]|uniref:Uncharacterized protein n=2 Tax=Pseudomonadati TaxID=3379134 RepID=Q310J2_OLEA2|nr:hypothetical protein Dde_1857 [Oleidesulfovibrio alaskensis G20]OPZ69197.1 MAG: hypothetical protein BWY83_02051 [bacterium ADurb.Bin478]